MKKLNTTYLDNLVSKILTETLEEKADSLISKIKGDVCECGGKMYEGECNDCGSKHVDMYEGSKLKGKQKNIDVAEPKGKITSADLKKLRGGEISKINKEYGDKYGMEEGIYDVDDLDDENSFDYVEESEDLNVGNDWDNEDKEKTCKYHIESFGKNDPVTKEMCAGVNLTESLKGRQRRLDRNKNNKIDSDDFKMLRKEVTKKTKESVKESYTLTESEMIDLIEKIIKEEKEKTNIKLVGGSPRGLEKHKQIQIKNGKENSDYIKDVTKKMKDYLKDGSNGDYDMKPKMFPKGNGELKKMDKKAFELSDDNEDFNYEIGGLQIPDYDEIQPNEEFMDNITVGSSKTGNNPEWGNAIETPVNKKFNDFRKKRTLSKIKQQSYNKSAQPVVNEKPGQEKGKGVNIKLESIEDKKTKQINEEFDRMKSLIGYSRKTQ